MDQKGETLRLNQENQKRINELRLLDDEFMSLVFAENIEATELLLNVILERDDLVVTEVVGQKEIKNANGRSVCLDIHAKDNTGRNFDVEIQRSDRGASSRRARFNSSMLDSLLLSQGQDFSELPAAYTIFITENDVLGDGYPLYHVNRHVCETNLLFEDGSHIIYVNGAYNNEENDIGKLMHDFRCTKASEMYFPILADKVRYLKETEGGVSNMSRIMDEIRAEGKAEGKVEGVHESRVEMALKLIRQRKQSLEEIAYLTDLSLEEVKGISQKVSA